jgi:hypothetical protein
MACTTIVCPPITESAAVEAETQEIWLSNSLALLGIHPARRNCTVAGVVTPLA